MAHDAERTSFSPWATPQSDMAGADEIADYLATVLPELYDFAYRLFRSPGMSERALRTALHAALETPDEITSRERLRTVIFRELYHLVRDSALGDRPDDTEDLSRLRPEARGGFDAEVGALLWYVATRLSAEQYAALHLQTRTALGPTELAEALAISQSYALVLLNRTRRGFEEAVAAGLLIGNPLSTCSIVREVQAEVPAEDALAPHVQRRLKEHLASGCETCARDLAPYGALGDLLALLAPVPVPEGLLDRLQEELAAYAERLKPLAVEAPSGVGEQVPVSQPEMATAAAGSEQEKPDDASDEPRSPWGRFQQWLADTDLPVQAIGAGAGLVFIGALLAFVVFIGRGPQPAGNSAVLTAPDLPATGVSTTVASTIATPGPSPTPGGSSVFRTGRPSTPVATAETLPELVPSPTPRITATPQNRSSAASNDPIVILNPSRPSQSAPSTATRSAQPARSDPVEEPPPPPQPTPLPPKLSLSSSSLTFARGETVKTVTISNEGSGEFSWRATPQQAWIIVSPSAGTVSGEGSLQVRVNRELASQGSQRGAVTISSEAGTITLTVAME